MAMVRLHSRAGVLAQRLLDDRTGIPAAVAELSTTIPPSRTDLVDGVIPGYGRPGANSLGWPPPRPSGGIAVRGEAAHPR